ncbi:ergothioneine biosynthesis protein EgtB [Alteromonas pelagimontana]|uniref:ergothioneine biosynthesis protein EgtB n=1 Tax=Alteromonas pelagimontana TaxID=1858656 RepID=UPI0009502FF1|nr:ergothioneine biosynthesis protein EgtB [Alteromonas pelagimontana]
MQQETHTPETRSQTLTRRFLQSRELSLTLCEPLNIEDYGLQAAAEVSPPKWHLAHTSWFYETFILKSYLDNYNCINPRFEILFNSYYQGVGPQFSRPQRGLLSRPTLEEVLEYRKLVETQIVKLIQQQGENQGLLNLVELGINHEQQHQELLLTDIKYCFSFNPLLPAYIDPRKLGADEQASPSKMVSFEGADCITGTESEAFHFDNETPAHKVYINDFKLANRLVTNGEYLEFIEDGGYQDAALWLSDGWDHINREGWKRPLYWHCRDGEWFEYTLHGLLPLQHSTPATHISYYEADAFARWAGKRLPTEFEWERAAGIYPEGRGQCLEHSIEKGCFIPQSAQTKFTLAQMIGDCWEWTSSAYAPYPGYRPLPGAVGEYNGKFMCNQYVLRGGSCVTTSEHIRTTYRNFFYPKDRWQFSGIRLAD